jgi:membrane protein
MAASHDSDLSPRHHGIVRRIWQRLGRAHAKVVAGGVAFFGVLAVFPALFALLSLYGLVADLGDVQAHAGALAGLLPRQVRAAIQTELMDQVSQSTGVLGIEFMASVLLASWSATSATAAQMEAVAAVRGKPESRNRLRVKLTAFFLTLGGVAFGAVALAMLFAAPSVLARLGLAHASAQIVTWLRWPVLAGVLLLGLAALYRYSSPDHPKQWRWISPGISFAASVWLSASALFSWFVARHTSYAGLDGSIAALTVLFAWFFIAAAIVVVGAAIDAESGLNRPLH